MCNAMKIALAVLVAAAVAVALVVFTETKKTHGADINSQLGIGVSAQGGRGFAHISQLKRFVDGERVGAANSIRNR